MKKILLVGELIIDEQYLIKKAGKSLETNNSKYQVLSMQLNFGGAGFVFKKLLKFNQKKLIFVTKNNKKELRIHHKSIKFLDCREKNIVKKRFWINNIKKFQVNYDNLKRTKQSNKFLKFLKDVLSKNRFNKIIISDYNHGLITQKIIDYLINYSILNKIQIFVDTQITKTSQIKNYKNVEYFFMNLKEKNLYLKKFNCRNINQLVKRLNIKNLIVKKGPNGIVTYGKYNLKISGLYGNKVTDEAGAGDTFMAVFAKNIGKYNFKKSLNKANIAAYESITEKKKYVR